MKILRYSTQFKKDIKRYANQIDKLEELRELLYLIKEDKSIPPKNHPHRLSGNYKGCWECHVQSDFLLIWIDENNGIVWLERIGNHSELFK
ncbi:MAG: type II toxin-antitoxin system YafQ family toxin [Prevotella sp.]|jgi:mRNA interferase YafQ|nr:type II toxin-antitoxin system YafQ family toxin [Prevotella sp.]MCI2126311.1 type II toxin-antitoxin system YafQ family toxin [Prevotella sp.]